MNRTDLQQLSQIRIKEAKLLLDNSFYDGAYYLCGYSIECALKACIAKNIKQFDFPDKKLIVDSYTHEINALVKLAGLSVILSEAMKRNQNLTTNWAIVKDWSEQTRYKQNTQEIIAKDLYNAVTDPVDGVMIWITTHW